MKRRAFTLVELLVVISIIGALIGLLLPAVQAARETSRRAQNSDNLRQIGLAIAAYEEASGYYPYERSASEDAYSVSWAYYLLPYLEQQAIYDSYVSGKASYDPANSNAMRTVVSVFINPSRPRQPPGRCGYDNNGVAPQPLGGAKVAAANDYAVNRGWSMSANTCCDPFNPAKSGPFGYLNRPTFQRLSSAMVTDGTSNTIAVGDKWIPTTVLGGQSWIVQVDFDSAGFCGDNPWSVQRGAEQGFPVGPDDLSPEKFGSPNGISAAFVFLDGHIAWINYSISISVLESLCAIGDGNPIPINSY